MKKIISIILVVQMVISISTVVWADASITASDVVDDYIVKIIQDSEKGDTYVLSTGQVISPEVVAAYAASITTNDKNVIAVDTRTALAYARYIAETIGNNGALLAVYKSNTPDGVTVLKSNSIIKGFKYYVLVQLADGSIKKIEAYNIRNGRLTYRKPKGVISEALVVEATANK